MHAAQEEVMAGGPTLDETMAAETLLLELGTNATPARIRTAAIAFAEERSRMLASIGMLLHQESGIVTCRACGRGLTDVPQLPCTACNPLRACIRAMLKEAR